jgi:hypothetical protein
MTSVEALEDIKLLCRVVSDTGIDMIIPPQVPLPRICAFEVAQTMY